MKKTAAVFCGFCLAISAFTFSVAARAGTSAFDGSWDVTLTCPKSKDGNAMGYSYDFKAEIKDGTLHGERGTSGEPGWLQLDGPIKPDGSAALIAEGLTNSPAYAINNPKKNTHYKHAVTAQFEEDKGSGNWITVRTCTFQFMKE
jgi:hypothetical protein